MKKILGKIGSFHLAMRLAASADITSRPIVVGDVADRAKRAVSSNESKAHRVVEEVSIRSRCRPHPITFAACVQ